MKFSGHIVAGGKKKQVQESGVCSIWKNIQVLQRFSSKSMQHPSVRLKVATLNSQKEGSFAYPTCELQNRRCIQKAVLFFHSCSPLGMTYPISTRHRVNPHRRCTYLQYYAFVYANGSLRYFVIAFFSPSPPLIRYYMMGHRTPQESRSLSKLNHTGPLLSF